MKKNKRQDLYESRIESSRDLRESNDLPSAIIPHPQPLPQGEGSKKDYPSQMRTDKRKSSPLPCGGGLRGWVKSIDSLESSDKSPKIRNTKKGKKGLKRVYNAFFYSLDGLKSAWCEEEAFRQIVIISAILIPLGAYLGESFSEKVLLIAPCVLAIIVELINSAIENAIDFAGLEIHPFAKKAKDMGSAIQLVACVFMAGVWIYYLIQRFVL